MQRFTVLALILIALFTCSPAYAEDVLWLSERGTSEGRAGCTWNVDGTYPTIDEWHFLRRSDRRYRTGLAVWASPAIAIIDGRPMAFIGGYDSTLHALDLQDKERKWFKLTNGEIGSAPVVGQVEGMPVVFFTSSDRTLYAHFAHNGARLWSRELIEPSTTIGISELSAPLLWKDKIFVCCFAYDKALARNEQKGWLIALDKRMGRIIWKLEISQGHVSSPVGIPINGAMTVFVAARKGLISAIDVSGEHPKKLWDYQMPHEVLGSPVVSDGAGATLFIGSKFGNLVALNAETGSERWKRMAGNWFDNTACIGEVDGEKVVFAGSHDYRVYAFLASDGTELWNRYLGGEVYSAPCFFTLEGVPYIAVASLDNHLYVINARDGRILTSYFTGEPIWDKVSKGDTVWGSPAVLEAGQETALVFGSFNAYVYVLPLEKVCTLTAKMRSATSLIYGLFGVLALFLFVLLPAVLLWPARKRAGG